MATKDPIKFDGGLNLYSYSLNDPINFIDSNGLETAPAGGGFWRRFMRNLGKTLGDPSGGFGVHAAYELAEQIGCMMAGTCEAMRGDIFDPYANAPYKSVEDIMQQCLAIPYVVQNAPTRSTRPFPWPDFPN